jgi:hypothetical protein
MLEKLILITSTEPYKSYDGMRVKEITIRPWETRDAKFVFEFCTNDRENKASEMWVTTCIDLAQTEEIPLAIIPTTQLKLYDDHPVLWSDKIYFSIQCLVNSLAWSND